MSETITLSDIQRARQRIGSTVRRTPQVISSTLSEALRTNIYCKLEMFQKTGSFKVRGVFNKVLSVPPEARSAGLVAVAILGEPVGSALIAAAQSPEPEPVMEPPQLTVRFEFRISGAESVADGEVGVE